MISLFVDGDACPVKAEVQKVAARHGLAVTIVSNGGLRPSANPLLRHVIVAEGADVADDWIVDNISTGDICITADIPLASRCLDKGARVLGPNGKPFTPEGIGMALAIVATGETVMREAPEPGAVLTRLAQSHIRFGHFEHFFHRGQKDQVRVLADHVIAEYFPDMIGDHAAWYGEVVRRTAVMVAQWQAVGFAHGVMNTDNMSILGLTIDYGPYGFLDTYDPQFICNHTDTQGRYSFINQPVIAHWNLRALAMALSDLIPTETLIEKLATFEAHFGGTYHTLMREKLGLTREVEGDNKLIGGLLALMARTRADYTLSFRNLTGEDAAWLALFGEANAEAQGWLSRYRVRTQSENLSGLNRINPKYVLRNWVAETAIRDVEDKNDVATLGRIFKLMQSPFATHDGDDAFAAPPPPNMCDLEVSCSS